MRIKNNNNHLSLLLKVLLKNRSFWLSTQMESGVHVILKPSSLTDLMPELGEQEYLETGPTGVHQASLSASLNRSSHVVSPILQPWGSQISYMAAGFLYHEVPKRMVKVV